MFTFNKEVFKKAWADFIEENPRILKDVKEYLGEDFLFNEIDFEDIAVFFTKDFEIVEGDRREPDLVALEVNYLGQPSDFTIKEAQEKLISLGQDKKKVEEVFDEGRIFEKMDFRLETLGEYLLNEIEKELGVNVYIRSKTTGTDYIGIEIEDFVKEICFPSLNAEDNIDENVVEDLILFRREEFEELEDFLFDELKEIYDEEGKDFNSITDFLNKTHEEDPNFFFNKITDYVYHNYSDYPYDFIETFIKDVNERVERAIKFENTILNKLKELDEIWKEEIVNIYFELLENPDQDEDYEENYYEDYEEDEDF